MLDAQNNSFQAIPQTEGGILIPRTAHDLRDAERERNPDNFKGTSELGEELAKRYPDGFRQVAIGGEHYIVSDYHQVQGITYTARSGNELQQGKDPGQAEVQSMVVFSPDGKAFNLSLRPGDIESVRIFRALYNGETTEETQKLVKDIKATNRQLLGASDAGPLANFIQIEPVAFNNNSESLTRFEKIVNEVKEYSVRARLKQVPRDIFNRLAS
ncbi:MAG TPA: hypothetical protein PLV59_01125 [Candidatus Dojkabacteria bacterium]|nr:hypothetical protein [Candidatus Dojkabacteria bacterium]